MSTGGFTMKVTPKPKDEAVFKNFYTWSAAPQIREFEGKVIFINANNAGKNIYSPYYVENGTASSLIFTTANMVNHKTPVLTLEELNVDDVIIHFSIEEWNKYMEDKKKKK